MINNVVRPSNCQRSPCIECPWYRRYVVVYASWLDSLARCRRDPLTQQEQQCASVRLDISHALLQFLQLLLEVSVLLRHFFVFGLPLVSGLFQGLDFSLEVACFDVGLTEPATSVSIIQL